MATEFHRNRNQDERIDKLLGQYRTDLEKARRDPNFVHRLLTRRRWLTQSTARDRLLWFYRQRRRRGFPSFLPTGLVLTRLRARAAKAQVVFTPLEGLSAEVAGSRIALAALACVAWIAAPTIPTPASPPPSFSSAAAPSALAGSLGAQSSERSTTIADADLDTEDVVEQGGWPASVHSRSSVTNGYRFEVTQEVEARTGFNQHVVREPIWIECSPQKVASHAACSVVRHLPSASPQ